MPIWVWILIVYTTAWVVVHSGSEEQCLERGYPITNVTVSFETYCANAFQSIKLEDLKK